jgi:hypothetical protein
MPRYIPPSDDEWREAYYRVMRPAYSHQHGIDFSDTLFVLSCGCILDGCIGAAGVDRFLAGEIMAMHCNEHSRDGLVRLEQILTVGDI